MAMSANNILSLVYHNHYYRSRKIRHCTFKLKLVSYLCLICLIVCSIFHINPSGQQDFVSHKPYTNPLHHWQMPPHSGATEEIECEPMLFTLQLLGMQMTTLHQSVGLQLLGTKCCLQYRSNPKMPIDLVDRSSHGGLQDVGWLALTDLPSGTHSCWR